MYNGKNRGTKSGENVPVAVHCASRSFVPSPLWTHFILNYKAAMNSRTANQETAKRKERDESVSSVSSKRQHTLVTDQSESSNQPSGVDTTESSSQPSGGGTTPTTNSSDIQQAPSQHTTNTNIESLIDPSSMIRVGDLVDVDNRNRGHIISISNNPSSGKYTVKYIIGNSVEYAISKDRIKVCSLTTDTTTRSGANRHAQQHPLPSGQEEEEEEESEESQDFKRVLNASFCTRKYDSNNPLYQFLLHNKEKTDGWLRDIIQSKRVNKKTNLNSKERQLLTIVKALFSGYAPQGQGNPLSGYQKLICKAFGICNNTVNQMLTYYTERSYSMERKTHSSYRKSVFNDESIRKKTYTGYNMFKRRKTTEFRDSTERLSEAEYQSAYEDLPEDQKISFDVLAEQYLDRSRFLWEELKDILLKTKGKVSFRELEHQLGGIVNHQTIADFLKTQEGFRLRKDRILPHLDAAAKLRRVKWAKKWWCFWKAVASIPTEDAVVVNVHMDEKWFFAVRTRTNCKELVSIGLEGNNYYVQHKSHIGKEMYVVVTAFVPNENDMTKGGKAIPIACIRCGKLVTAAKTTYKRVYKPNGKFHYPHIDGNESRIEGNQYFECYELSGDSEGTKKDPKCSLLKFYKEQIIPEIERKIVDRFSNNGRRAVIIVKQEDSAGPHQNKNYVKEMNALFQERGWILFNQPSQSPMTNVHDACIFPMMSKCLSKIQAVDYYARILKGEELHDAVMKVWNDHKHTVAMSRAFAGHSQVVCAILENNGDNNYLSEKKGLSFGIRKMFVPDEDGTGIIPVPLAPTCEGETAQGVLLSERSSRGLRYTPPDLRKLDKIRLSRSMIKLLNDYADGSKMSDDVHEVVMPMILKFQKENEDKGQVF